MLFTKEGFVEIFKVDVGDKGKQAEVSGCKAGVYYK